MALALAAAPFAAQAAAAAGGAQDGGQPLFRLEGRLITEASGIAVDPTNSLFYVNQDAGNSNELYVVDLTGRVRAVVAVPAVNEDWEDVATGASGDRRYVYLADTGDAYFTRRDSKASARTGYAVVRLDEPVVGAAGTTVRGPAQGMIRWPFTFEDGATHNAESMAVQPGTERIFVADKTEKVGVAAYLWAAPRGELSTRSNTFSMVAQIPVEHASGAAFSSSGSHLVVRNADTAYVWTVRGGDVAAAVARRPVVVPLPAQRQGEGVAFTPDGTALLLSSEGVNSLVWQVPLPPEAVAAPEVENVVETTATAVPDQHLNRLAVGVSLTAGGAVLVLAGGQLLRRRRGW